MPLAVVGDVPPDALPELVALWSEPFAELPQATQRTSATVPGCVQRRVTTGGRVTSRSVRRGAAADNARSVDVPSNSPNVGGLPTFRAASPSRWYALFGLETVRNFEGVAIATDGSHRHESVVQVVVHRSVALR